MYTTNYNPYMTRNIAVGPYGSGNYDDRFGGFFVPFLLGGLGGAAVVGLSRPRPVVVNPNPYYGGYPYPPGY